MNAIRFLSAPQARRETSPADPHQAFVLLRMVFTIAPIAFGLHRRGCRS